MDPEMLPLAGLDTSHMRHLRSAEIQRSMLPTNDHLHYVGIRKLFFRK
jgi:hypothetical protein